MMKINANSPEGNAFAIIGAVMAVLKRTGRADEGPEVRKRMMSGSYGDLCDVAEEVTYGTVQVVNRDHAERKR